jgi:hypothetical protein
MTKRRRGAIMKRETAFGATDKPDDTREHGLRLMMREDGK